MKKDTKDRIGSIYDNTLSFKRDMKCTECKTVIKRGFMMMESTDNLFGYIYRTYCKDCFLKELELNK